MKPSLMEDSQPHSCNAVRQTNRHFKQRVLLSSPAPSTTSYKLITIHKIGINTKSIEHINPNMNQMSRDKLTKKKKKKDKSSSVK